MPPLLPKPSDCTKCEGKPRLTVREDDNEAVVKHRMDVYNKQTSPLIQYYTEQVRAAQCTRCACHLPAFKS